MGLSPPRCSSRSFERCLSTLADFVVCGDDAHKTTSVVVSTGLDGAWLCNDGLRQRVSRCVEGDGVRTGCNVTRSVFRTRAWSEDGWWWCRHPRRHRLRNFLHQLGADACRRIRGRFPYNVKRHPVMMGAPHFCRERRCGPLGPQVTLMENGEEVQTAPCIARASSSKANELSSCSFIFRDAERCPRRTTRFLQTLPGLVLSLALPSAKSAWHSKPQRQDGRDMSSPIKTRYRGTGEKLRARGTGNRPIVSVGCFAELRGKRQRNSTDEVGQRANPKRAFTHGLARSGYILNHTHSGLSVFTRC